MGRASRRLDHRSTRVVAAALGGRSGDSRAKAAVAGCGAASVAYDVRGDSMSRGQAREFWCPVVSEAVLIRLKRPGGFGGSSGYFVQCNQGDCQYVEQNKPPCPLHPDMFTHEIRVAEDARLARRAGTDA
jgi:hypothetical protein